MTEPQEARASRRGKPPIAAISEERAVANIKEKARILRMALGKENLPGEVDREALLMLCPTSPRQFNKWSSEDLPEWGDRLTKFWGNSQKTLVKNDVIWDMVSELTEAIKQRQRGGLSRPTRIESMASLSRRLDEAVILKRIVLKELDVERTLCDKLSATLGSLRAAYTSLQEESKEQIARLMEENREYRKTLNISHSLVALQAERLHDKILKISKAR